MKGDYDTALKLRKTHLCIAQELRGILRRPRAAPMGGQCLQCSRHVRPGGQATTRQELQIHGSERPCHHRHPRTETSPWPTRHWAPRPGPWHYQNHLNIAGAARHPERRGLLANLGNFHCSRGIVQAAPIHEQYLRLAPDLQDMEGEGKVCHNLGLCPLLPWKLPGGGKSTMSRIWPWPKTFTDKLSQAKLIATWA